jgi:Flp pilus assembly protein TadD
MIRQGHERRLSFFFDGPGLTGLGKVQQLSGDLGGGLVTLEEALRLLPQEIWRPELLISRGELCRQVGKFERAEQDLREAIALGHPKWQNFVSRTQARTAA